MLTVLNDVPTLGTEFLFLWFFINPIFMVDATNLLTIIPEIQLLQKEWEMWQVTISLYLDEKVVSFTRTLLFLIRPKIGNSAILRAAALCNQESNKLYYTNTVIIAKCT